MESTLEHSEYSVDNRAVKINPTQYIVWSEMQAISRCRQVGGLLAWNRALLSRDESTSCLLTLFH
jgi:hypothetical protein